MKKTLLFLTAVCVFALFLVVCTGCNKQQGGTDNSIQSTSLSDEPSIVLPQDELELFVNQTAKITPELNKIEGRLFWQTTDPYVASVDQEGLVTARSVGTATISVFNDKAGANITIKVVEPKKTASITFASDSVNVDYYAEYKLNPVIIDCDGPFTWSSSDEGVVKVDNEGNLTPVKVGSADVQITGNGKGAKIRVNIVAGEYLPTVSYDRKELYILKDMSLDFGASVAYRGNNVSGYTAVYELQDGTVATVDDNGVITGINAGTTTLTVDINYRGYKFPTITVPVTIKDDVEMRLSSQSVTIYTYNDPSRRIYSEQQVTVSVFESGNRITDANVSFEAENETVATVSAAGTIRAVAKGNTTVLATYTSEYGLIAIAKISVSVEWTVVNIDAVTTIQVGTSDGSISGETYLPLPDEIQGTITAISGDNGATVRTLVNPGIVLTRELLLAFDRNNERYIEKGVLNLYSDNGICYEMTVDAVTLIIKDIEDLNKMSEYGASHQTSHCGYYVLNADIDGGAINRLSQYCGGNSFTTNGFRGVFDGRGHVIKNLTLSNNYVFSGVGENAVIKNLAFIDPIVSVQTNYSFISELQGATLENVFLRLPTVSMIGYVGSTSHIRNVVFVSTGGSGNVRMNQTLTDSSDMTDVIYVANGYLQNSTYGVGSSILKGCHVYNTTSDLIADLMSEDYLVQWENSSFAYASAGVTFGGDRVFGVSLDVEYPSEVYANSTSAIVAANASYSLKEAIDGVSIDSSTGELTVGDVAPNTVITIIVKSNVDEDVESEITVTVVIKPIDLTENGTYDVVLGKAHGISAIRGNVLYIKAKNGVKTGLAQANVITAAELLSASGASYGEDVDITFYTENEVYVLNASFITKVINSYDDLVAMKATTVYGYYVLGKDITFNNTSEYEMCPWGGDFATGFRGIFDGRGHYLYNLFTVPGGMFHHLGGGAVVKNVAFIEPRYADESATNSVIASENHTGVLKDVYVYSTKARLVAACDKGSFTGCVFDLTAKESMAFKSFSGLPAGAYKGILALTDGLETYTFNAPESTRVSCYQFKTVSALQAALVAADFPFESYFSASYWNYDAQTGAISWKGDLPAGNVLTDVTA